MTDGEKAIVMAHTGICMLTGDKFQTFHKYVEDIMGRPILTHEIGWLADAIKEKSKADFMALCADESGSENPNEWISVSERLPEDFGLYLITLENGDVCQCEFNPDFIDEEHENGAFTYYHQYFDYATLGMIDEEEEAVDAIAWMQFEPFEPQEGANE